MPKSLQPDASEGSRVGIPSSTDHLDLFSTLLRESLQKLGLRRPQELADRAGLPANKAGRLLTLTGRERVLLAHLRKVFAALTPVAQLARTTRDAASAAVGWADFIARRPDFIFFELAAALAGQRERLQRNPAGWLLSVLDEGCWQIARIPTERWIITDKLGENLYPELLKSTCDALLSRELDSLVFILPNRAKSEFDRFLARAADAVPKRRLGWKEKMLCIAIPDRDFILRMRIDDAGILHSKASGVISLGSLGSEPLMIRMPDDFLAEMHSRYAWLVQSCKQQLLKPQTDVAGAEVYYPIPKRTGRRR